VEKGSCDIHVTNHVIKGKALISKNKHIACLAKAQPVLKQKLKVAAVLLNLE